MAHIDWVLVAELAFLDRHDRLCIVGAITGLKVSTLPVHVRQISVVARVSDRVAGEQLEIGVVVLTPQGEWAIPGEPDNVQIEVVVDYVIVTLRDIPITEEGAYRFAVYLDKQTLAVDVPVAVLTMPSPAGVH